MRPVFIGGCDRSGTTMLGAMLGGHPRALAVPESHFRFDALPLVRWADRTVEPRAMLEAVCSHRRSSHWDPSLRPEDYPQAGSARVPYADVMHWLVERHARRRERPAAPEVWIDHTPSNLRHTPSLTRLFPEAVFIHIVRDGRGVAASLMPCDWGPNTILKAAQVWKTQLAYGLAAEAGPYGARVARVRYEDLLGDPEGALRALCDHAGLDYHPRMARGGSFDVPADPQGNHALVSAPPDRSRAEAWRRRLRPREVELFEHATRELLASLGYELEHEPRTTRGLRGRERLRIALEERLRTHLLNPIRRRRRQQQRSSQE